jgi:hypothetical protein
MCLHALVEFSAHKAGYHGRFSDYLVLGDDVAVFNREVYQQLQVSLEKLGVQTNPSKSTQRNCRAEMAKQFFWKGHNVTGFPLDLLVRIRKDPNQFTELGRNIVDLGYEPIPAARALSLVARRYRAKLSRLILIPEPLGHPSAFKEREDPATANVRLEISWSQG